MNKPFLVMKLFKNIYIYLFTIVVLAFFLYAFSSKKLIVREIYNPENGYNIYAIDIPEKLDFSGEALPIQFPDVRERIDRELLVNTYWQSNGLLTVSYTHLRAHET